MENLLGPNVLIHLSRASYLYCVCFSGVLCCAFKSSHILFVTGAEYNITLKCLLYKPFPNNAELETTTKEKEIVSQ